MTNHGDDCYFFYYSTCTKGDSCPFRHCEAAMGNETVCNLWQEGRCFRTVCKFRHMEITKNRKEIPCYWENQAAGCQKPHCAFFHEKPRYIDGMFVSPDKSQSKNEEQLHEEPAPPPAAPLPTAANPQLRGVIKTEAQEPVPSPTHPPVVINPADDDEDEDDQFSEEGDDGRVGPSPRKLPKSDDSLNFGVSTLEEIRLRKALKASMKRAGYPLQSTDASANREKENIQSFFRPALYEAGDDPLVFEETGRPRGSVAERLGRKMPNTDVKSGEGVPLKRSLAERLGRVMDEKKPIMPPQKALRPVKERLGLSAEPVTSQPAETNTESKKAPEQIRIKTLEEIKQEKAAKCQPKDGPSAVAPELNNTRATKALKRAITIKHDSVSHVKTFSEILHAKKKRQQEQQAQNPNPKKAKHTLEKAPGKSQGESDTAGPGPEALNVGGVRVKTLEEIRREKAARIQAQQALEADSNNRSDTKEDGAKKPGLLCIKKLASQTGNKRTEKSTDVTEKPQKTHTAVAETTVANGNNVKVKTFEEIMREKRLRSREVPDKSARNSVTLLPAKQAGAAPQGPSAEASAADKTLNNNQKKSPEQNTDTKVRPKLNVKPSVMKPAVQVKPGQKRGAERSAVAAVKPLNSASTLLEEPLQETACRERQVFPPSNADAQLSSTVPCSPNTLLDSSSSPLKEELKTVPVFKHNLSQDTKPAASVAAGDPCTIPQSPVLKTPTQPKTRRMSTATPRAASTSSAAVSVSSTAASTSAVDDFDELINEFTDDHLEDEEGVDPGIGEDDLLQELSEMIDS